MKKRQHRLDINLYIGGPSGQIVPPAGSGTDLVAEGRVFIRQNAKGGLDLRAELSFADTPLAKQVFERLDWLDWPL